MVLRSKRSSHRSLSTGEDNGHGGEFQCNVRLGCEYRAHDADLVAVLGLIRLIDL